jgi:hypothetical protein
MTRKDSEKDSDRPHYYSQFWLDVAAGRRVIGGPKSNDETEQAEGETAEAVSPETAEPVDDQEEEFAAADGQAEIIVHPVLDETIPEEEFVEPNVEEEEQFADEAADLDLQDTSVDDIDVPDMDLTPPEEEEEELYGEEQEEEEEDEDIGWGGRGRKKPKPGRQTKPPVKKPGRRDQRRPGY